MALSRGDRLGPYEIVEPLGVGGMSDASRHGAEELSGIPKTRRSCQMGHLNKEARTSSSVV